MYELLKPPVIPLAILNFFSGQPDFPAVAGDMAEEYQQHAQSLGDRSAKLWYWRESLRNAFALTWREIYRTPARTIFVALTGYVAMSIFSGLYIFVSLQPRSVDFFLGGHWDPMDLVQNQGQARTFLLLQFIVALGMGWISGKLLSGREWAVALWFAVIPACIALPGAWYLLVAVKPALPMALWKFMISGGAFRLSGFWLGSLWIRHSRNGRTLAGRVS